MKQTSLLLTLLLCLFFSIRSSAQLGEYAFTQTTETYTGLTTTNIPLDTVGAGGNGNLRRTYPIQLPFYFTLGNITSDSLYIDLAGFCALKKTGAAPTPQYTTHFLTPMTQMPYYAGLISPLAGNFSLTQSNQPGLNTGIRTDVSGTSPNRVFTVEWRNLRSANWNIQVKLHETSNVIDFCYSTFSPSNYTTEIGLRLADSTLFTGKAVARTNIKYVTGTNLPRYARLDSMIEQTNVRLRPTMLGAATFPTNLKFTWTPPSPCNLNTAALQLPANMTICAGQFATLRPQGYTSGLSYQWQVSANNTSWANVTDGEGATNFQYRTARFRDTTAKWYRLQATCTATSQAVYSNAVKINATAIQAPYFEGFENIGGDNKVPECLTIGVQSTIYGGNGWATQLAYSNAYRGIANISSNNADDALYTPGIFLEQGKQYRFTHYFKMAPYFTATDSLRIGVGRVPTPDSINVISTKFMSPVAYNNGMPLLTNQEMYRRMETVFSVPNTGIYFGGIRKYDNASTGSITLDNIELMELLPTDVMVDSIMTPSLNNGNCFNLNMPLTVRVTNAGTQPVSNIPMYFKSGPSFNTVTYGPETITQTIAPGTSIYYTFTQQVPLPNATYYYKVQAWSALTADTYKRNDTSYVSSFQGSPLASVPYVQTFEGASLANFDWNAKNTVFPLASTTGTTKMMRTSFGAITTNTVDSAQSITIDNITTSTFLRFKYRMANSNGATAPMAAGDTLYVVGVANCGAWRDTLLKIHAGMQTNSAALVNAPNRSLAAFAGNRLRVHFLARKTSASGNVFVDIDSFQVINLTPADMAITGVQSFQTVACANSPAAARLYVKNNGGLNAANFSIKALVNGQPSTLNYTYPGSLGYNESDTIAVGNIPFGAPGTYDVRFYLTYTNDAASSNDTLVRTVYVVAAPGAAPSFDSTYCVQGSVSVTNPDSTVALWYAGIPGVDRPDYTTNTTPVLTQSDTFTVLNKRFIPVSAAPATRHPNWSSSAIYLGYGLNFSAHSDCILDSVGMYVSGTGNVSVEVISCADCPQPGILSTWTYPFTNADPTIKQMVPVKTFIPAGSNYAIRLKSANGVSGIIRDFPFTGFPLSAPQWPVTITTSKTTTADNYDYYYYFYDWKIKALSDCAGTPGTVGVKIKDLPNSDVTINVNGHIITPTNQSTGGGTYAWTFGDGNSATGNAPIHTYTASGTYILKMVQTNDCGKDSVQRTVKIAPYAGLADLPEGWNALNAWPNPATNQVNVSFTASKSGTATLLLADITGRTILAPVSFAVNMGENTLQQSLAGIAPGTYYIMLSSGGSKVSLMLTVIK